MTARYYITASRCADPALWLGMYSGGRVTAGRP
jgi:hypothetical protein